MIDTPIPRLPIQCLDGVSGTIFSMLTVVVVMDLSTGIGRFNLARGFVSHRRSRLRPT